MAYLKSLFTILNITLLYAFVTYLIVVEGNSIAYFIALGYLIIAALGSAIISISGMEHITKAILSLGKRPVMRPASLKFLTALIDVSFLAFFASTGFYELAVLYALTSIFMYIFDRKKHAIVSVIDQIVKQQEGKTSGTKEF